VTLEDELWEYAIKTLSERFREDMNPPPNRVTYYLDFLEQLPVVTRSLGVHERLSTQIGHHSLMIFETRFEKSLDSSPRLIIRLRDLDDSITNCIAMEIVARPAPDNALWALSVQCAPEEAIGNFTIMLTRLVAEDLFAFCRERPTT
jgi:hypothetical protein